MHQTNLEQKKEFAYEATHDNLTGVYNRNGYDAIQKSVDWNTCALVLFDLDRFKPRCIFVSGNTDNIIQNTNFV